MNEVETCKKRVVELLLSLKAYVPRPKAGVCGNMRRLLGEDDLWWNWIFNSKGWDEQVCPAFWETIGERGEDEAYPVPYCQEGPWVGEAREHRIVLIDVIIDHIQRGVFDKDIALRLEEDKDD